MAHQAVSVVFLFSLISGLVADFPLTILHTNDVHARFINFNAQGRPCIDRDFASNKCWGGAARRQTAMKKFLAEDENVLKLDGGDQFQGTLWYTALKWEPIAAYLNVMKYDAMSFGNHEFDDGMQGLEPFVRNLTTPIVNSNIEDVGSPIKDLYQRKIIKLVGGQKIGIVGCTTVDVPQVAKPGPQLQFIDEATALKPFVDELVAAGVNKIIVLSHAGIKVERQICQKVKNVDIVVGGHSHSFLWSGVPPSFEVPEGPYPEVYTNKDNHTCLLVQDYAYGKYLGRLKVFFDDSGELTNWTGNPVPLDAATFPEDQEIANILKPYHAQLEHFQKTVVTTTAVKLDGSRRSCRLKECNLGNMLADAALYFYVKRQYEENSANQTYLDKSWSPASIALWNSGGVRDFETPAGSNVTLEDLYTIMPFANTIDKITIKGVTLKEAFEHAVTTYLDTMDDPGGIFLQVSGIKIVYDLSKPAGQRVKRIRVRCNECGVPSYHELDLQKLYDVVTHTFMSHGGDGFTMFRDKQVASDGSNMLDVDVVLDYVKSYKPMLAGEELRIQYDNGYGEVNGIPPQLAEFNAGHAAGNV